MRCRNARPRATLVRPFSRLVLRGSVFVALVLLLCLGLVVAGQVRKPGAAAGVDDWFILLVPLIPPLVTVLGWSAARWGARPGTRMHGFLTTIAGVSGAYSMLAAVYLVWHYDMVSADGTAYWGLLAIPAVWLWLPATVAAAGVSVLVTTIGSRQRLEGRD